MALKIDYKEVNTLKKYTTKRGKILARYKTGLSPKQQRKLSVEIKRSRFMALIPYISRD